MIYKLLEIMGESLGSFAGGFLVKTLEIIEPHAIEYAAPLIDMLLDSEELPSEIREFLVQLKTPTHEIGAAFLTSIGTGVAGNVINSALGAALSGLTRWANRKFTPARPTPGEAWAMTRMGTLSDEQAFEYMLDLGFPGEVVSQYAHITRQRPGVGDVINAWLLGNIEQEEARSRMAQYGLGHHEQDMLFLSAVHPLDVNLAFSAYFRGIIDESALDERLMKLGYQHGTRAVLKEAMRQIPGPSDLVTMAVREAWRDDVAGRYGYDEGYPTEFGVYMAQHGFDPEWAKRYWRSHWDLPSVQSGYEMLHRGIISVDDLRTLLSIADIPSFWRENLIRVSYSPFTRVDVRRMYGLGVLDREGVKRSYMDIGYDDEKAELLTEFTVRYENEDGTSQKDEFRKLTQAQILRAMTRGLISQEEAVVELTEIGYHQEDAEFLIEAQLAEQDADYVGDVGKEYHNFMRRAIESAYINHVMDEQDAAIELQELGYTEDEATLIVNALGYDRNIEDYDHLIDLVGSAYTRSYIDRSQAITLLNNLNVEGSRQSRLLDTWQADRDMPTRRLTEAQYRKALTNELITVEEYTQYMEEIGYTPGDIELLVQMATG